MVRICWHCSAKLTKTLRRVDAPIDTVMGEEYLDPGALVVEDGTFLRRRRDSYITHTSDVIGVHLTSNTARLNGCCGLDGCDGPNLCCNRCGSYVAVKMTDCWMAHCVVFEPGAAQAVVNRSGEPHSSEAMNS